MSDVVVQAHALNHVITALGRAGGALLLTEADDLTAHTWLSSAISTMELYPVGDTDIRRDVVRTAAALVALTERARDRELFDRATALYLRGVGAK